MKLLPGKCARCRLPSNQAGSVKKKPKWTRDCLFEMADER
jgi:hypothetical protein